MDTQALERQFNKMGARVKFDNEGPTRTLGRPFSRGGRRITESPSISIDIRRDEEGEFFEIVTGGQIDLSILDVQKEDRHLLLLTKDDIRKQKFLCGHDERHWFTCAIPEDAGASTVLQAKDALKPTELKRAEKGLKKKNAHKRHRKADVGTIHRQGEFSFVPDLQWEPPSSSLYPVLKNEPMRRGGKPHVAEFLFRSGGETVYTCSRHRNGIKQEAYNKLIKDKPEARNWGWRVEIRNPTVYAKGHIRHSDHKTIDLKNVWHKVILNTEDKAWASRNVAFID